MSEKLKFTVEHYSGISVSDAVLDEIWNFYRALDPIRTYEHFMTRTRTAAYIGAIRSETGRIVGIGTAFLRASRVGGRACNVLTAGAMIDPKYRGAATTEPAIIRCFLMAKRQHPFRPVLVYLTAGSAKGYKWALRNVDDVWPRPDAPTPEWASQMLAELGTEIYGDKWDNARGVSTFPQGLSQEILSLTSAELAEDPALRFHFERCRGEQGVGLACIGRLRVLSALRRLLQARLRRTLGRTFRRQPVTA